MRRKPVACNAQAVSRASAASGARSVSASAAATRSSCWHNHPRQREPSRHRDPRTLDARQVHCRTRDPHGHSVIHIVRTPTQLAYCPRRRSNAEHPIRTEQCSGRPARPSPTMTAASGFAVMLDPPPCVWMGSQLCRAVSACYAERDKPATGIPFEMAPDTVTFIAGVGMAILARVSS